MLAFRVGIIGHRPNRLPKDHDKLSALRRMLRTVLEVAKSEVMTFAGSEGAKRLYFPTQPIFRAISPLAEGTDRIFAEEAMNVGYELLCPMPFHQDEFEKDFQPPKALEPNSLDRFQSLLKRAHEHANLTKFELDGDRSAEPEAYGCAGSVVLNQSDLLIAVWDGDQPAGGGGTVETLKHAVQSHVPTLWIDALVPDHWQLLRYAEDVQCLEGQGRCVPRVLPPGDASARLRLLSDAIRTIVRDEIALPEEQLDKTHAIPATRSHVADYFRQRRPLFNFAVVWKLFRNAVGSWKFERPEFFVRDFEEQLRDEWPTRQETGVSASSETAGPNPTSRKRSPTEVEDWVNRRLLPHYAWADKRGDLYADAYRSAYILIYLLSAAAVFVALLPMAMMWEGTLKLVSALAEFVILVTILLLLLIGRTRHWRMSAGWNIACWQS